MACKMLINKRHVHNNFSKNPIFEMASACRNFSDQRAFCKTQANSSSDIASLHDDWILVSTLHDSLDLAAKFRPDSTKNPFKPSKRV